MNKHNSNLFANIRYDAVSGLIVFLIALPLCLGIALASEAPLFSGIVAGIIGGILVGFLSGSQLSVTGPAAGLIAIVLGAIGELKAFDIFLCSVIVAGLIQFLLGILKAGTIANYFPNSVIEGMLAGIGLTIIIKQIPDAVGYTKQNHDSMVDAEDGLSLSIIEDSLKHIEMGAAIIALVGLTLLVLWQTKAFGKLKTIPSGLVVVILGVVMNAIFKGGNLYLDETHLVSLPVSDSFSGFLNNFMMPDFNGFMNPAVWRIGAIIAVVASIETLLCLEATDKLDPYKRYSPTNRELRAQGIGNMVSGLIGGLPVTSVIVRSSANINAGARTKLSAIVHGVLLLVCVATIPAILNLIPKASLAAILIYTGYRLCKPSVFMHMLKHGGWQQFIPFFVTALSVVIFGLLVGVGIGMVISIFYILRNNMRIPYYYHRSTYDGGELVKLTLSQEVSFLNKASIKETLESLPENTNVVIDASQTEYIDFDVLDLIKDFHTSRAADKNIKLSLIGFKSSYKIPAEAADRDVVTELEENSKPAIRSAGGYKKLLKQLTGNN
ncbi:hypothetical protein CAP35_13610 [Chitinophagaceae bacterium IBVUCB1]|nr:hypothetical protein CAP35_13610 [Chitinophagaceae bacterium IBVUCB1]